MDVEANVEAVCLGLNIVMCLVAWPLNESKPGVDLVLIETSLLFSCKFLYTNQQ